MKKLIKKVAIGQASPADLAKVIAKADKGEVDAILSGKVELGRGKLNVFKEAYEISKTVKVEEPKEEVKKDLPKKAKKVETSKE